ncbi:MAG: P-loop NTPase family protein [Henriciella sp.]
MKGHTMLPLSALGDRIMVLGPSNAGKSTLALALSEKLGLPAVHLDQLHHLPNTDWVPRPEAEFKALHDEAILADQWVMDGNYTRLMPARFERATGVILITSNHWLRLGRYFRRTLAPAEQRAGTLEGGQERIKWMMIDWILFKTPRNAKRYARIIGATDLPAVHCKSAKALNALYEAWALNRPNV